LQIRESYHIGPFTLDSVAKDPTGSLNALEKYDLAIIAKPTEMFSDAEKQVLDQFIINGGDMACGTSKCGNGQSLQCFRIYICVSKGSEFE
jgi:hypothetical protein